MSGAYTFLRGEYKRKSRPKPDERNKDKHSKEIENKPKEKSGDEKKEEKPESVCKDPDAPDRSFGDYYCKMCDSHMNSENMWQAHIIGKRHLKTIKKGDPDNRYEYLECESKVKHEIRNVKDPVIGLSYINEIRRLEPSFPETYCCFLCHANLSTVPLVIEHVLSLKHRLNYLKENDNAEYELIESTNLKKGHKEPIVYEAARKMEDKYGRGEVRVKVEKPKPAPSLTWPSKKGQISDDEEESRHGKYSKRMRTDDEEPRNWKSLDDPKKGFRSRSPKRDMDPHGRMVSSRSHDDYSYERSVRYRETQYNKDSHRNDSFYDQDRSLYESKQARSRTSYEGKYDRYSDSKYRSKYDKSPEPYGPRQKSPEVYGPKAPFELERARGGSPTYNRSNENERNMLPHEAAFLNQPKDKASVDLTEFLKNVLELPTMVYLRIALVKADSLELTTTEHLSLLTKLIKKYQDLIVNVLGTDIQSSLKQPNTAPAPSPVNVPAQTAPAPVLKQPSTSDSNKTKSDFDFIFSMISESKNLGMLENITQKFKSPITNPFNTEQPGSGVSMNQQQPRSQLTTNLQQPGSQGPMNQPVSSSQPYNNNSYQSYSANPNQYNSSQSSQPQGSYGTNAPFQGAQYGATAPSTQRIPFNLNTPPPQQVSYSSSASSLQRPAFGSSVPPSRAPYASNMPPQNLSPPKPNMPTYGAVGPYSYKDQSQIPGLTLADAENQQKAFNDYQQFNLTNMGASQSYYSK